MGSASCSSTAGFSATAFAITRAFGTTFRRQTLIGEARLAPVIGTLCDYSRAPIMCLPHQSGRHLLGFCSEGESKAGGEQHVVLLVAQHGLAIVAVVEQQISGHPAI